MATKSLTQQILDSFIEELSKEKSVDKDIVQSLKALFESGKFGKEDILNILKKEEKHEATRT